jgi:hypothetical protein
MSRKQDPQSTSSESTSALRERAPNVPRWLPPALFAVLTVVLFRVFVFSDGMLLGSDTLSLGYVARLFYANQLRAGSFPLWAPQILGGTPFLEALSGGDALYPTSLLLLVMEPFRALGWKLVLHIFLAGVFMYGWMRTIGASKAAALLSGTAYMLAPFLVSLVRPGHDGKIFVTALTPLLFWVVERFFVRARIGTFSAVGLVVALVLLTTHFQMAYFLFGAVGLYAVFRTVQLGRGGDGPTKDGPRRARAAGTRFVLFLAASLAGLGAAAVQFIPSARYVTEYSRRTATTREAAGEVGAAWSSSWSLHPEEAMSLVIPEFAGNDAGGAAWSADTYWGRNFSKDNSEYGGILVLILAAVSFVGAARRDLRWFLTCLGGVALLFALGEHTPVWRVFYVLVPGIRLFRSPSTATFLFGFAAATLAGLGLDRILRAAREDDAEGWRRVLRVLWACAGALVVLAVLASSGALSSFWTSVVYPDIGADALHKLSSLAPFIARGAVLAAVLGLSVAAFTWALRTRRLPPAGLLAALLVLVAADEMRVDAPFIQVIDFQRWAAPDPLMQALLRRERGSDEPYRLLSFVDRGQDVKPALYGIDLVAGHHPNDLARYRELIGMVGSDLPRNLFNTNIQRLLNVRYLLWPDYHGAGPPSGDVVMRTWSQGRPYETLYAWPGLPRARLVARAVVKPDAEQVPYMLSAAFDPDSEVVLSHPPPIALQGGPVQGAVTWQERTPNELRLSVTSDRAVLLVVADNWFPAWHATVDGRAAPVLRAYHTLRAVPVSAGTHTVEMFYRSRLVDWSLVVSVVVSLVLLVGLGWDTLLSLPSGRRRPPPR